MNEREAADDADVATALPGHPVYALVQLPPFKSEGVLLPLALQVDQGALALTEHQMLEGGEGKEVAPLLCFFRLSREQSLPPANRQC
jgi:hypothetical protein